MRRRQLLQGLVAAGLLPAAARATHAADTTLRVVTLNLWHDKADWPARMQRIVPTLRALRPDVIVLQEVLQHETLPNQATALADAIGYEALFFSLDAAQAPRRYGNAVLTRHPVITQRMTALQPLDDYRSAAHVRIAIGASTFDVYATHLHHMPDGGAIRARQVEDLVDFIAATRGADAAVLAGDFNAPADAPELHALTASFRDAYDTRHPQAGQTDFRHSTLNPFLLPPLRVDHVFHGSALKTVDARLLFDAPIDGGWASDHFGVLADLALRPH